MEVPLFVVVVVLDDVEAGVVEDSGVLDGYWRVVGRQPDDLGSVGSVTWFEVFCGF